MLSEDIKIAIAILVTAVGAFLLKRFFSKLEARNAAEQIENRE